MEEGVLKVYPILRNVLCSSRRTLSNHQYIQSRHLASVFKALCGDSGVIEALSKCGELLSKCGELRYPKAALWRLIGEIVRKPNFDQSAFMFQFCHSPPHTTFGSNSLLQSSKARHPHGGPTCGCLALPR